MRQNWSLFCHVHLIRSGHIVLTLIGSVKRGAFRHAFGAVADLPGDVEKPEPDEPLFRRLGQDALIPHRMKYKKFMR